MIDASPDRETLVGRATEAFTRYRKGERAALDELVATVTPLLWRTVRAAGLDAAAAEDVVQTVWLGLLRSGDAIRDPHNVVKWLLTSARREAWRVYKRTRAEMQRRETARDRDGHQLAAVPERLEQLPDEVVLRDARARRLWEHVQELPLRCRQLIGVIAFADRPDYALLAESLGMPVGSIGPTRGRCLAKLRNQLEKDPLWEGWMS